MPAYDYSSVRNKQIALLVWNTEKEYDAHVYLGKIVKTSDGFHFKNKSKKWDVLVEPEQLHRLKEVTDDLKEILLKADLYFSFSIAGLPEDSNNDFVLTGMKWHD